LGLDKGEEVFSMDSHPYEYTYPWSTLMPHEVRDFALYDIHRENNRFGFSSKDSLDLANVSDKKIEIEALRLVELLESIIKQGFKQQNEDALGCFVLADGATWRWYVQGGQHRAAVMAALGYNIVPVYVRQIIRREEVNFWPNVQSGIFSKENALIVFDKLFAAEPPTVAGDWVDYVNLTFNSNLEMDSTKVNLY